MAPAYATPPLAAIPPELHLRILHFTILLRSSAVTNYLAANPLAQDLMAAHCCLIFARVERHLCRELHAAVERRQSIVACKDTPNRLGAFFAADDKVESLLRERERVRVLHCQIHSGGVDCRFQADCRIHGKDAAMLVRPPRWRFWELEVAG